MNSTTRLLVVPKCRSSHRARPVASKITIKQFYLPGGSSTQLKGVPSDIALALGQRVPANR